MGRRYHGNPAGRLVRGIYEPVVTNFAAHPDVLQTVTATSKPSTTTMIWSNGNYEAK
jgi:hypothetical protein